MKIKVNKNQFLDDYEAEYQRLMYQSGNRKELTPTYRHNDFETVDVTEEEPLEYIKRGYGIKINC